MPLGDKLKFEKFSGPESEIYAQVQFKTSGGYDIDTQGLSSVKVRLQLGSADELTMALPSRVMDKEYNMVWRPDMSIWQNGSIIHVDMGYDGEFTPMQHFEIVSSTNQYQGSEAEMLTIRGVSELARAARNQKHRTWDQSPGDDLRVIDDVAAEYGWTVDVDGSDMLNLKQRVKKAGKTDLDLLKLIASQARLGGPRVDYYNTLFMPKPVVGKLKFTRGIGDPDARRLHTLSMERDGGASTRVLVVSWDPTNQTWVEKEFQADKFSGDPVLTFEGAKSEKELRLKPGGDIKTQTLTLAAVEHSGHGSSERVDVLNSAVYEKEDGLTAEELAKRYFELREKLSRWATVTVDGHPDIVPYVSIELQGDLAEIDKGHWLPLWVEHTIDSNGWMTTCRVVRIVDERNFPVSSVES
jgi:phage protein D